MSVVAAELDSSLRVLSSVVLLTQSESREVESCRPALTALDELRHGGKAQVGARGVQEQLSLVRGQREAVDPDLRQLATAPQSGDRQVRRGTAGEHEQRAFGGVLRESPHGIEAFAGTEQVRIVENENDRLIESSKRGAEPRNRRGPDGGTRSCECVEHVRCERFDPVKRQRHVPEEDDRIVVTLVHRHPSERPRIAWRPLRQNGRLSIACRSGQDRNRF
jgi:hypothetical protein